MIAKVKKELKTMKADQPGKRFRNQHKRAKKSGFASGWMRVVCLVAAAVSFVIGVVLVFIPGPAFVFFLLTGALLASQWFAAAKALDRGEVKGWQWWRRGKKKLPAKVKKAVGVSGGK